MTRRQAFKAALVGLLGGAVGGKVEVEPKVEPRRAIVDRSSMVWMKVESVPGQKTGEAIDLMMLPASKWEG